MQTFELLDLYEQCARPYLDAIFQPATCIEQTRVLLEVMGRFGVEAKSTGVVLLMKCPAKEIQYATGLDAEELWQARRVVKAPITDRANNRGEVCGGRHVVALVDHGKFLVDPTWYQASIPEVDFYLEPEILVVPVPEPMEDLGTVKMEIMNDDGLSFQLEYYGRPERDWEHDEGWEPSHLMELIGFIERDMRAALIGFIQRVFEGKSA